MTTKQYLQQARKLDQRIDAKLRQIEDLTDLALRTTTTLNKDKVVGGPVVESKTADAVNRIVDLSADVNADIDKLVAIKRGIATAIDKVDNIDHKLLLELRYLNWYTWEKIAVHMGITWQWCHVLHGRALRNIEQFIVVDSHIVI